MNTAHEYADEAVDLLLQAVAADGLRDDAEARSLAWVDLLEALCLRAEVAFGFKDWRAVEPELQGSDRTDDALQICCERVDAALQALIGTASAKDTAVSA